MFVEREFRVVLSSGLESSSIKQWICGFCRGIVKSKGWQYPKDQNGSSSKVLDGEKLSDVEKQKESRNTVSVTTSAVHMLYTKTRIFFVIFSDIYVHKFSK